MDILKLKNVSLGVKFHLDPLGLLSHKSIFRALEALEVWFSSRLRGFGACRAILCIKNSLKGQKSPKLKFFSKGPMDILRLKNGSLGVKDFEF